MRVMLDTNILVSHIFFPSAMTRRFFAALSQGYKIVLCDYVIEELWLVTERKFPQMVYKLDEFFTSLSFEMVYTPRKTATGAFPEIRDEKDSPILATAILEDIDVLVTGDKDFLVLDVEQPKIMTMTEFIEAGY